MSKNDLYIGTAFVSCYAYLIGAIVLGQSGWALVEQTDTFTSNALLILFLGTINGLLILMIYRLFSNEYPTKARVFWCIVLFFLHFIGATVFFVYDAVNRKEKKL